MSQTGSIIVQIYTARQAIPIEGVSVIITTDNLFTPELLAFRMTDIDGKTTPVVIETPDISISQEPSEETAFATCNIQLDHPQYYSVFVEHVQVFADTESIQEMEMIPLEEFSAEKDRNKTFIITPQDL